MEGAKDAKRGLRKASSESTPSVASRASSHSGYPLKGGRIRALFGPLNARLRRSGFAAAALAASVTGLAALLQWFWAGWDIYAGPGPSAGMRWLLTGTVGAAVLLPMGAALVGAAVGRRLADPSLREQLRVTRSGVARAALLASAWAMAPLLLAAVLSVAGWTLVVFLDAGRSRFPSALAIWLAHSLVVAIGAAYAVWGLALSVGALSRVPAKRVDGRSPLRCRFPGSGLRPHSGNRAMLESVAAGSRQPYRPARSVCPTRGGRRFGHSESGRDDARPSTPADTQRMDRLR